MPLDAIEYYEKLSKITIRLEKDPVAAGGYKYINEKLATIRDMSEDLAVMATEIGRELSDLTNIIESAEHLYKLKYRSLISVVTPAQKRGKSSEELKLSIQQDKELLDLEAQLVIDKNRENVLKALQLIVHDRSGELKRANSDIRLQTYIFETEKSAYGSGRGGPSRYRQDSEKDSKDLLEDSTEVNASLLMQEK